jgi:hypothetical protein
VIGENRHELGLVFGPPARFHGAGRPLGESGVRRRKNSERTRATQRFNEPGGLPGGDPRGGIGRADGNFDPGNATTLFAETAATRPAPRARVTNRGRSLPGTTFSWAERNQTET